MYFFKCNIIKVIWGCFGEVVVYKNLDYISYFGLFYLKYLEGGYKDISVYKVLLYSYFVYYSIE